MIKYLANSSSLLLSGSDTGLKISYKNGELSVQAARNQSLVITEF